jgi:hypothetical protein
MESRPAPSPVPPAPEQELQAVGVVTGSSSRTGDSEEGDEAAMPDLLVCMVSTQRHSPSIPGCQSCRVYSSQEGVRPPGDIEEKGGSGLRKPQSDRYCARYEALLPRAFFSPCLFLLNSRGPSNLLKGFTTYVLLEAVSKARAEPPFMRASRGGVQRKSQSQKEVFR